MKKNISVVTVIFALVSLLFTAKAFAVELEAIEASPKPGQGSVQLAERYHMDPTLFIKMNKADHRFKNNNPSLIYTWQSFIVLVPRVEKESSKAMVSGVSEKKIVPASTQVAQKNIALGDGGKVSNSAAMASTENNFTVAKQSRVAIFVQAVISKCVEQKEEIANSLRMQTLASVDLLLIMTALAIVYRRHLKKCVRVIRLSPAGIKLFVIVANTPTAHCNISSYEKKEQFALERYKKKMFCST